MKPGGVSVTAILDEAAGLVSRDVANVAGWAGLLALTSLPLRFLEAHFLNRLFQLGDHAANYVTYLLSLSWLVAFALLPAFWGRAVFARACALALSGRAAGRGAPLRALRPSFPSFAAYAYVATVAELLLVLFGWTVLALPLLALYAGLAAATSYLQERPGPLASLALPLRALRPFFPFLGLTAIFAVALLLALINLFFLFALGLWLAGGASGLDLSWWQVTLTPGNQQYLLLLIACAVTVVEPFWIAALVAAVRRVRARESGEDLAAWFAEVRNTDGHGPARPSTDGALPVPGARVRPSQSVSVRGLLLAALFLLPTALAGETISPAAYRDRLQGIQGSLRANDWVRAKTVARGLLEDRIAFGKDEIETDRSVLGPIANAATPAAARAAAPALSQLVTALSMEEDGGKPPAPDPKLLEKVRAREALAALPQGGKLPEVQDGGLFAALTEFLEPIAEAISGFFEKIWDWLLDLLLSGRSSGESGIGLNLVAVTVLVVVLALVLGWVGWRVLRSRRHGAAPAVAGPAPLPPSADDDPLSREANEWERYARELAAAGRAREAIRAWYHAVLVAFYRAGTLHYRKGRTNWEYVSAVPPGTAWRSRFVEITRHFEREWYGRDRSTPEALRESEEMALSLLSAVRERAA
ncbi:MAG TPA: DUF4129 domain-containing protein [Thermoanaerobaculia bacterium]|nr:DUF4129 domain-containing protein [Thermoanaerobaculia bacterium]